MPRVSSEGSNTDGAPCLFLLQQALLHGEMRPSISVKLPGALRPARKGAQLRLGVKTPVARFVKQVGQPGQGHATPVSTTFLLLSVPHYSYSTGGLPGKWLALFSSIPDSRWFLGSGRERDLKSMGVGTNWHPLAYCLHMSRTP